jgi:hypothetical protein
MTPAAPLREDTNSHPDAPVTMDDFTTVCTQIHRCRTHHSRLAVMDNPDNAKGDVSNIGQLQRRRYFGGSR